MLLSVKSLLTVRQAFGIIKYEVTLRDKLLLQNYEGLTLPLLVLSL